MDKVELVDTNCGLQLWRKLTREYESKWKSRHLSRHQAILNLKFPDDVMAGFDQFEKKVRQYHAITGKHIDEDTMSGVVLGALVKSSNERHRDLANHLVLNPYRLDSYNKILVEIREILDTKKYMNQEGAISAVSNGQITIKFAGNCWVCGKSGQTVGTTQKNEKDNANSWLKRTKGAMPSAGCKDRNEQCQLQSVARDPHVFDPGQSKQPSPHPQQIQRMT